MLTAGQEARKRFQSAAMELTLGGEPTYVPLEPKGAEWSVAADGPSKLSYARALAKQLESDVLPGSICFFCPGKHYPGETNPRWALRLLCKHNRKPLVPWPVAGPLQQSASQVLKTIGKLLGLELEPSEFKDPLAPDQQVWAVPITRDADGWQTSTWPLAEEERLLVSSDGPPGLRLPLNKLPEDVPRQVLTLDCNANGWGLFLPPLAPDGFEQLLEAIAQLLHENELMAPQLSGVVPIDQEQRWLVLGITADPGVLEVNLPVCETWQVYAEWLVALEKATAAVGLRSWKQASSSQSAGTGGGNHLLWGGPTLERNPLFQQPAWLGAVLRYWQAHPCLSYLFIADPVGAASQAPRSDEIGAPLLDLEMALFALEQLPAGDQRQAIAETMRHLQVDRSGNPHRSEISFDKFWNPGSLAGCQGLVEFRAIETLPKAEWMAAVALLWSCLGAMLLEPEQRPIGVINHGGCLHDRHLLPSLLWSDFEQILQQLNRQGLALDAAYYRQLWQWRFPVLLHWSAGDAELVLRRALEPWPLLSDMPELGAITSRFVDTSLQRIEICTNESFRQHYQLRLQGRKLALKEAVLGARLRQGRLFPCLHPSLPSHWPLCLDIEKDTQVISYQWQELDQAFQTVQMAHPINEQALVSWQPDELCVDLRLPT